MKIITEDITDTINIIKESKDKSFFIEGIFMQCDVKNRNGRIYPLENTIGAVQRYNRDFIQTGRSLGELGHPDTGAINLHLASHMITELRQDNKNFIGKAKIIDTPMGNIAKTLIKEGVKLGVSLRGFGTLTERNGARIVGNDFVLSTVDIVADPSAPDAFVNGIMENSQQYYNEGILLQEHYDYVQKSVKNMSKTQLNEGALLGLFENLIKTLK